VVNVEGGAIAHGHPIGASGAVLTTRLLQSMKRDGLKRGIVTLHRRRQGIALALLQSSVKEGDEVVIDVRGRNLAARVVKPPFVQVQVREG